MTQRGGWMDEGRRNERRQKTKNDGLTYRRTRRKRKGDMRGKEGRKNKIG